jgi:hypothetical protein
MKLKLVPLVAITLSMALAGNALAYSGSTKGSTHNSEMCKDKLGSKGVKKADRKAEWTKCMADPAGYQ